jgi:hypothetical protein
VLLASTTALDACLAPASIRVVVDIVVVNLLLRRLARVWKGPARRTLFFSFKILVLAGLRRGRRRRDWLVGEEVGQVALFLHLVAQNLMRLALAFQMLLEARANHRDPRRGVRVISVLGSYEAADAGA